MGMLLDGVDDEMQTPNSVSLQIVGDLTIAMWLYVTSLAAAFVPLCKSYSNEYEIYCRITGDVLLQHGDGVFEIACAFPVGTITTNTCIHLAVTRNIASKVCYGYKNGTQVVGPYGFLKTPTTSVNIVDIGRRVAGVGWMPGIIASSRIYNRVLSPFEILRCMKGLSVPEGLVLHYDFWGPRGSDGTNRIRDLSPYGNHGTNGGGVAASMAKQIPIPDFPPLWKQAFRREEGFGYGEP